MHLSGGFTNDGLSIIEAALGLTLTPATHIEACRIGRTRPGPCPKHHYKPPTRLLVRRKITDPVAAYNDRLTRLTKAYESGIRDRELLAGGKMGETYRVTFNNGSQGILKTAKLNPEFPMLRPELQTHNEVLGAKVGAAAGIDSMPAAIAIAPDTVLKEYGEGEAWGEADQQLLDEVRKDNPDDLRRLGFFDVLTHNGDRHEFNLLVQGPPGRRHTVVPIDHGNLFGPVTRDEYREVIPLPEYSNPEMTDPFTRTGKKDRITGLPELEYLADGMTVGELETAQKRVTDLKPDFDAADLTHQYRAMQERLDLMLKNARYRAQRAKTTETR